MNHMNKIQTKSTTDSYILVVFLFTGQMYVLIFKPCSKFSHPILSFQKFPHVELADTETYIDIVYIVSNSSLQSQWNISHGDVQISLPILEPQPQLNIV